MIIMLMLVGSVAEAQQRKSAKADEKYLYYVQTFADHLLEHGLDRVGQRPTAMWASVIDTRDYRIPIRGVAPTKGVRPHDRALGGANYYQDVETLRAFDVLTTITGDARYAHAAKAYSQDFLHYGQHPKTGLLGWGEHLYYNFFTDTVSISESRFFQPRDYFKMPHELLAWTPPWERLWQENEDKTAKAIEGLIYHFNGPDPKTYLFNRHAQWNEPVYNQDVMPWIKHAALYAYSWAFLYDKTGNEKYKHWAEDIGLLYWNLREYDTDLVFNCYYHSTEPKAGKNPGVSATGLYAYWVYRAAQLTGNARMKEAALAMMVAYHKYGWHEEKQSYYNSLNLDGTPGEEAEMATAWQIGYGSSSAINFGRAAAYLYQHQKDERLKQMAVNCADILIAEALPAEYTAQNIGEAINMCMDVYDINGDARYLTEAKKFADMAIGSLWKNGLFARQVNDDYYEAKLGVGDLLAGLLRIHLAQHPSADALDWSF